MEKISENIVKLRVMNGLTQDDLAERLGLSRQTIHNWETGDVVPRGKNLKLLCDTFKVTLDQLLGKEPLNFDKKIEIAIDGLKTNLKEEEIKTNKKKKTVIIKKVRNIVLILLVIITSIYVGCSLYKFGVLTHIGNKVSKYENLDNYYCEIQTYQDKNLESKEEIWYKDNKYKIEKNTYNDIGQIKSTITDVIDLNNNTKVIYNDGNSEGTNGILLKEMYENGNYMYNMFPDIVKNRLNVKIDNALKVNFFKTELQKDKNVYRIKINSMKIELDKDLYTPIFYTNGENNDNRRMYFNIKLNCVEDDNLTI